MLSNDLFIVVFSVPHADLQKPKVSHFLVKKYQFLRPDDCRSQVSTDVQFYLLIV